MLRVIFHFIMVSALFTAVGNHHVIMTPAAQTTKYSMSATWQWRHSGETVKPRVSAHAVQRWDDRTPSWSSSPESAFDQSIAIPHLTMDSFTTQDGAKPDAIHYVCEYRSEIDDTDDSDTHYEAFFIQCNNTIVTIYTRAQFATDEILDGLCYGLWKQFRNNDIGDTNDDEYTDEHT